MSRPKTAKIRRGAWYGDLESTLEFPSTWDVIVCRMAGHDMQPIDDEEIGFSFAHPIGSETVHELAKGKEKAVIIFDDLDRPTPVSRILPFVLEELREGGIGEDHIKFVCALGAHRPRCYVELEKKLGKWILERFYVFNHNVYEHFVDLGRTRRGTPVKINREVMECDLRIGVGAILPHGYGGFGGGAKIILPGVSSLETIAYHHCALRGPSAGLGKVSGNEMRLDMEEAARMAGLDIKVDAVLNNKREIVGLFVGDFIAEHRAGCTFARTIYTTQPATNADIVVLNSYPYDTASPGHAFWAGQVSLRSGGDVVYMYGPRESLDGSQFHYAYSQQGTKYGGPCWSGWEYFGPKGLRVPQAKRLIVMTEKFQKVDFGLKMAELPGSIIVVKSWDEVLGELKNGHGAKAKVAVYPYAPIQCPPVPKEWVDRDL